MRNSIGHGGQHGGRGMFPLVLLSSSLSSVGLSFSWCSGPRGQAFFQAVFVCTLVSWLQFSLALSLRHLKYKENSENPCHVVSQDPKPLASLPLLSTSVCKIRLAWSLQHSTQGPCSPRLLHPSSSLLPRLQLRGDFCLWLRLFNAFIAQLPCLSS